MSDVKVNASEMNELLAEVFEQVASDFDVEEITPMACRIRLNVGPHHLRPGGTISGPSMFSLADVSAYVATMAMIGPQTLTVTTNVSIDFMRKPESGRDLIAHTRVLKLGKLLSVSDVLIYSEGMPEPVARASLTYAIPPR